MLEQTLWVRTHPETVPAYQFQVGPDLLPQKLPVMTALALFGSHHLQEHTLSHDSFCPSVVLCSRVREPKWTLSSACGMHWVDHGNLAIVLGSFNLLLHLVLGVSKHVCALPEQSLDFFQ